MPDAFSGVGNNVSGGVKNASIFVAYEKLDEAISFFLRLNYILEKSVGPRAVLSHPSGVTITIVAISPVYMLGMIQATLTFRVANPQEVVNDILAWAKDHDIYYHPMSDEGPIGIYLSGLFYGVAFHFTT